MDQMTRHSLCYPLFNPGLCLPFVVLSKELVTDPSPAPWAADSGPHTAAGLMVMSITGHSELDGSKNKSSPRVLPEVGDGVGDGAIPCSQGSCTPRAVSFLEQDLFYPRNLAVTAARASGPGPPPRETSRGGEPHEDRRNLH